MKKLVLSLSVTIAALLIGVLPALAQCPAVGADAGCGLVINIGSGGTLTITATGQPPFDSFTDDTLIGVTNNSGLLVTSINLSGGLIPIFAFDGDGLCTFGVSGCPFGSTGYEGPMTSFSNINGSQTAGTVNFTGGGLANNTSTYFSLEGNLKSSDITGFNPVPEPASLILLGSSFIIAGGFLRRRRRPVTPSL